MIYVSPEDEWKHWLYAVILTLSFQDLGFNLGFRFLGFRVLVFVVLEGKNLNPAQGFEHVKGYAGLAAGKPRGCSEHVAKCWKLIQMHKIQFKFATD